MEKKMQALQALPTPCYVVDEEKLIENGKILKGVASRTGAKVLLAQKAFSTYSTYPLLAEFLDGTTASGLYEAKLGKEEFANPYNAMHRETVYKETHVFSAAYKEQEMDEIIKYSDHIVFNSFAQFYRYRDKVMNYNRNLKDGEVKKEMGIRVNPQFSTQEGHEIYDPCGYGSRLGVTLSEFEKNEKDLQGISGLHFHTLCEQNSDDLYSTLMEVEKKFGKYLSGMQWINFGGGHHVTREDYDIETLEKSIRYMQEKYDLTVYIEPGEAVALNAGFLVAEVLDIVHNDIDIAILDTSAACHMPDVIEMPYQPRITGASVQEDIGFKYPYRLGGPTCLAGDVIGDYFFEKELKVGDKLIFHDMAIYSMVKNNTFNGMPLPSIYFMKKDGSTELIRAFGYEDFKNRL